MDFNEYQGEAVKTAIYHKKKIPPIVYCGLKLAGEAGEVSEKIGKLCRDADGELTFFYPIFIFSRFNTRRNRDVLRAMPASWRKRRSETRLSV